MRAMRVLIGCALLVMVGCGVAKPTVDTAGVDEMAKTILTEISEGKATEVYDKYFSEQYKSELKVEEWLELAKGYKQRLGKFKSLKSSVASTYLIEGEATGVFNYVVNWEKTKGRLTLNMTKEDAWKIDNIQIVADVMEKSKSGK